MTRILLLVVSCVAFGVGIAYWQQPPAPVAEPVSLVEPDIALDAVAKERVPFAVRVINSSSRPAHLRGVQGQA